MEGYLNDIVESGEKLGGRKRLITISTNSEPLLLKWNGEFRIQRQEWTWANNRNGEGYMEEKLDRIFFGSVHWVLKYQNAKMKHVFRKASNHNLVLLRVPRFQDKSAQISIRQKVDQGERG